MSSSMSWIKIFEDGWRDQRRFGIMAPLEAIEGTTLAASIQREISEVENLAPPAPASLGFTRCAANASVDLGGAIVSFLGDGALASLRFEDSDTDFASGFLGRLAYRTMQDCDDSRTCDLSEFRKQYLAVHTIVTTKNETLHMADEYGKKNCTAENGARSTLAFPRLSELWCAPASALIKVTWPLYLHTKYGAPEYAWVNVSADGAGALAMTFTLFNKTATRYPEAGVVGFQPALGGDWAMDKAGSFVKPSDVVRGGSRGLHAVRNGVNYRVNANTSLFLRSLDAPVVSWDGADPYPKPVQTMPDSVFEGVGAHFVLFDNLWDTNYVYWQPYDDTTSPMGHLRYRFRLEARVPMTTPGI